jgi:RNA polymerase sigma-70 factor, ECF subfamily
MDPRKKFGRVYSAQVTKIYRYIRLKVSSRETAEDLTAQVFERGWIVYRQSLDPEHEQAEIKNMRAFLYQLARHAVVDYYRIESRKGTIRLGNYDLPDEGHDPAEAEARRQETNIVLSAMSRIKPDYQDLIIQRYLNGLSLEEIAEESNRSIGAVKTALHRAREALKAELEDKSNNLV